MTTDPTSGTAPARPSGATGPAGASAPEPDDTVLDPAAGAALIRDQRARVVAATSMDGRVLFGAWGVAWLVGYVTMWAAWPEDPRIELSYGAATGVFVGLLLAAGTVTAIHVARRSAGVRGTSAAQGAMYGWAWFLTFAGVAALGGWLGGREVPSDVMAVTMTVVSTLVVGALYMAGGAMLNEPSQFVLGAWICVANVAGLLAGAPALLLVMGVAGGGGMLLAALVEHVRRHRGAA